MTDVSSRCGLFLITFLLTCCVSACCTRHQEISHSDQIDNLSELDRLLEAELTAVLGDSLSGLAVDVSLLLADQIDTRQYRNGRSTGNPNGLDGPLHELFLLVDTRYPKDTHSFLSRYELIVDAANCVSTDDTTPTSCPTLRQALRRLSTPKRQPTRLRSDWPQWRPIAAMPANWAEDGTPWSHLQIGTSRLTAQMDYIYVGLLTTWYSAEFLEADNWYLAERKAGFISDGHPENDHEGLEFLPRIPVGFLLARDVVIQLESQRVWSITAPHIIAWVFKPVGLCPRISDPELLER